ncbi:endonuclease/exonuclease/phosphatase family protein [uncultured Alistipes sp.]|jgi:endonuclease/exonuclease/phosphatase family metal-dependent hydrolase|uniref:endonuclease/exonuclease/phosphatase family protein n=1 Tax=uncultured Alistipes sp. TaxID=538949 RepID=UPI0025CF1701|nr:endonuclease/exonuclease/phosphatase family protein [uncultured Alistipes sp.]
MKSRIFIAAACLLCNAAACSSSNNNSGTEPKPGNGGGTIHETVLQKYPEAGEVKVMSFNVRYGSASETNPANNWDFRKTACVDLIKDQKPTVVGFQEAVYNTQWLYFKAQLADAYDGFGVGRDDGAQKGECMGILFRKADVEKIDGGTFWLSETPDKPSKAIGWGAGHYRSATWGLFRLKATGRRFCYINTHLDLVAGARAKSMELILARFAQYNPDGHPQLLTADFNTTSGDAIFAELKKSMGLARDDAPEGHTDFNGTYNGWGAKTGIIDHVFYTKTLAVKEYHTVTESYGSVAYVSDHYPIYAIIEL